MNRPARRCLALSASFLFLSVVVSGARQAQPAAAPTPTAGTPVRAKYYPPVKGVADLGFVVKQKSRKIGNEIVTVLTVKNLSETHAIHLLRAEEFWYNKKNEAVGGNTARYKKPLAPGELADLEIRTPYDPSFYANNYSFLHAYGKCTPRKVATLDALMKEK